LEISLDLFETLMKEYKILPRFKEFVLLFGAKVAENEIGHPQMRFRRLTACSDRGNHRVYAGFGI